MSGDGIRRKIIDLLGAGVPPTQVAMACGVTDSYVSQLLSQEEVSAEVTELRAKRAHQYIEHDDRLDTDEEVARRLVRRNLDNALLKPMEALAHFKVLNGARRQAQSAVAQTPVATVVNLQLPAITHVQFRMTTEKQVIEVDGRSLATMPASTVNRLLREKKAGDSLQQSLEMATEVAPKMKINTPSLLDSI